MINFNRILYYAFVLGVFASSSCSFSIDIFDPYRKYNYIDQHEDHLHIENLQQKQEYGPKLEFPPDHPPNNPSYLDHFEKNLLHFASQISDANSSLGRCCFEKPLEEKHICMDQNAIDFKSFKRDNLTCSQRNAIKVEIFRTRCCFLIPKLLQTECLEAPEGHLDSEIRLITSYNPNVELFNNIKWTLKRHMKHCHKLESYSSNAFWNWAVGFRVLDYASKLAAFLKYLDEESTSE